MRYYVFADESGNTDFSRRRGATTYFGVATVLLVGDEALDRLRADLLRARTELAWQGIPSGAFHASEDAHVVRDAVFDVVARHELVADVTLFEKAKTQPHLRADDLTFFAYAWHEHLRRVAAELCESGDELMISVAAVGTHRLRAAFRTTLERVVRECGWGVEPQVVFAPADSDPALQAADYVAWAATRSVERADGRALARVADSLRSCVDAFAHGGVAYY